MRRVIGWLLVLVGVVIAVPAGAAAAWVGPDDTAQTGPHALRTAGAAIMSEPEVLHYVGPVLHLTVERADGGPVFVGVAYDVDADSYLGTYGRRVVSHVTLPWTLQTVERTGTMDAVAAPGEQPWWLTSVAGDGARELVWPLTDGRYDIVALNADGSPGVDATVTLGLEVEGTFYTLLAVATFGLLLLLLGMALLLWRRRRAAAPAEPAEPAAPATPAEPAAPAEPAVTDVTTTWVAPGEGLDAATNESTTARPANDSSAARSARSAQPGGGAAG